MAIAFSDSGVYTLTGDVTTASFSMSCSGTNRILYVGLYTRKRTSDNSVSSMTYNGDAMTAVGNDTLPTFVDNRMRYRDYYLTNPDDGGDHSVSVTMSSNTDSLGMTGLSFNGAAQEAPEANNDNTGSGTSSPMSASVTTVTDGAMLVGGLAVYFTTSISATAASGQTEVGNNSPGFLVMAGGYESIPTAGSEAMSWSFSGNTNNWGIGVASLAPAAEAAATNNAIFFGGGM